MTTTISHDPDLVLGCQPPPPPAAATVDVTLFYLQPCASWIPLPVVSLHTSPAHFPSLLLTVATHPVFFHQATPRVLYHLVFVGASSLTASTRRQPRSSSVSVLFPPLGICISPRTLLLCRIVSTKLLQPNPSTRPPKVVYTSASPVRLIVLLSASCPLNRII